MSPSKDVDGFHVVNVGRMCLDQSTMLPATPWGIMEIIKRTGKWRQTHPSPLNLIFGFSSDVILTPPLSVLGIPTLGKNVVVAGRSKNVGMPVAMLLHTDGRHERPGGECHCPDAIRRVCVCASDQLQENIDFTW